MTSNDTLANTLSKIDNCIKIKKNVCQINPVSKVIKGVLSIMQKMHYVGEFKELETAKGGLIEINLIGGLNKCGSIKPRYPVKVQDMEKFEKRYLPAKGFGYLIVSTSQGMMTQDEAIKKNLGGKLIAYFY